MDDGASRASAIRDEYVRLYGSQPPPGSPESPAPVGAEPTAAAEFIRSTETFVQVYADSVRRRKEQGEAAGKAGG